MHAVFMIKRISAFPCSKFNLLRDEHISNCSLSKQLSQSVLRYCCWTIAKQYIVYQQMITKFFGYFYYFDVNMGIINSYDVWNVIFKTLSILAKPKAKHFIPAVHHEWEEKT